MSKDGLQIGDHGFALIQGVDGRRHAEAPGKITAISDHSFTVETKAGVVTHYNRHSTALIGFVEQQPAVAIGGPERTHQPYATGEYSRPG